MLNSRRDATLKPPDGYQEALHFLYDRIDYERSDDRRKSHRFRLERTEELFELLGLGRYLFRDGASAAAGPEPTESGISVSGALESQKSPSENHGENPSEKHGESLRAEMASPAELRPTRTHRKPPVVHIAGTKGKGSTAMMLGSILSAAGYRVGLYTSPHLTDLEERFRIDGEPCSRKSLIELVRILAPVVARLDHSEDPVSFFELTTAMAVLYFDRNDCDVIILEVGLGGRLDSTNVCASDVAAVTSIGLDHQRVLGNTIPEIAAEKAGIIKGGVPVVSGVTSDDAADVIRDAAAKSGSKLFEKEKQFFITDSQEAAVGNGLTYRSVDPNLHLDEKANAGESNRSDDQSFQAVLSIDGAHQIHNASLAISIACLLNSNKMSSPLSIRANHIVDGLRSARCIGRMERFCINLSNDAAQTTTQVIVDTAHNQDSITALCDSVRRRIADDGADDGTVSGLQAAQLQTDRPSPESFFRRPVVVVCAVSRDKDVEEISALLANFADQIICTTFTTNPRALTAEQLAHAFVEHSTSQQARTAPDQIAIEPAPLRALDQAIRATSGAGGTVMICGSFFLAGELRPHLLAMPNLTRLDDWCGRNSPISGSSDSASRADGQSVSGLNESCPSSQESCPSSQESCPGSQIEA